MDELTVSARERTALIGALLRDAAALREECSTLKRDLDNTVDHLRQLSTDKATLRAEIRGLSEAVARAQGVEQCLRDELRKRREEQATLYMAGHIEGIQKVGRAAVAVCAEQEDCEHKAGTEEGAAMAKRIRERIEAVIPPAGSPIIAAAEGISEKRLREAMQRSQEHEQRAKAAAELERKQRYLAGLVDGRTALNTALGFESPWPVTDVLRRLAKAARHLYHEHGCDLHGYEGGLGAAEQAEKIVAALEALLAGDRPAVPSGATVEPLATPAQIDRAMNVTIADKADPRR